MKCLVLGGGGFIGSHLCNSLINLGHQVRVFTRHTSGKKSDKYSDQIQWFEGDFASEHDLTVAVSGIDIIYHLISTTLPSTSNLNIVYDVHSNVVSTLKLLNAAKSAGVKKVIFTSSGGTVYGIPQEVPISVNHATQPICSYGIHKLMIEKYLDLYYQLYGLDYAVMRISNPYGEWQNPAKNQGAISVFLYKALRGESIEIWGNGSVIRDYIYISDVVNAALKLIDLKNNEKIFNIGSGQGLSLNELLDAIKNLLGIKLDVKYSLARPIDVPINVLDISRTKDILNWEPEVDLATGLNRSADYMINLIHSM